MDIDLSFFAHSPAAQQWERIHIKPHHGLVIPLFSLHSAQSCGIGEFTDLLPIVDWCARLGFDVIQLLPLNDTGLDASPYNALSAFALNPIHLGLSALPYLEQYPFLQEELKIIPRRSQHHWVNYSQTREAKGRFLKHYYQLTYQTFLEDPSYQDFLHRATWLKGYAVFKTLKELHHWHCWEMWPLEFQNPTPELLQNISEQYADEVNGHCLLQYLCDQQLQHVKAQATASKILLMGDIPILISRDSTEVWLQRDLFDLTYSAGAPPDIYSEEGQNWGFPLYNWEKIAAHNYEWWTSRLNWASQYYNVYRLDHIIGFFRIWAIPLGGKSKDGHFIPANSATWIDHGQKILLIMLNHCNMLPIGEDLGIVSTEIRSCLAALGICGTKVMRWERDWTNNDDFYPPNLYPLASMTTVSTHDSETLQLWWQNNPADARAFADFKGWCYHPRLSRANHWEILWDSHHSNSLFRINLLQEYLALIPGLTWPNLELERINQPGLELSSNWSYCFKPSVEEIIQNSTLAHLLKTIIL